MLSNPYLRGEIWWVNLDPGIGVETRKTRPCLILQNNEGNKRSSIVTVAPFLSMKRYFYVTNVKASSSNGLDRDRGIHLNQMRGVDSSRVLTKLGEIESSYWVAIKKAIDVQLGFFD